MAAPSIAAAPYVPLMTQVNDSQSVIQLNQANAGAGDTAWISNIATWFEHAHGEAANQWFIGTTTQGTSPTTMAKKLTDAGVQTSNYRNGIYVSQATSGQANFAECASAENNIPLGIHVFWPGDYLTGKTAGGGVLNASVDAATTTITIDRLSDAQVPTGVPGDANDTRRRCWPYGRLTHADETILVPNYAAGANSVNTGTGQWVRWVRIDDEILQITAEATEAGGIVTVAVRRGIWGTTPAAHTVGAKVLCPVYIGGTSAASFDTGLSGSPRRGLTTQAVRYALRMNQSEVTDWIYDRIIATFGGGAGGIGGHSSLWLDIGGSGQYNQADVWSNPVNGFNPKTGLHITNPQWGGWQAKNYWTLKDKVKALTPDPLLIRNGFGAQATFDNDILFGSVYNQGLFELYMSVTDTGSTWFNNRWTPDIEATRKAQLNGWPIVFWVRPGRQNALTLGVDITADLFTSTVLGANASGLRNGDRIEITATTMPSGLAAERQYYVKNFAAGSVTTGDSWKLSAVRDLSTTVDITTVGSGVTVVLNVSRQMRVGYASVLLFHHNRFASIPWQFGEGVWELGKTTVNGAQEPIGTTGAPDDLFMHDLGEPVGTPTSLADLATATANLYRRDYSKGIVLMNAADAFSSYTLPANHTWWELKVNGPPTVATTVTIPPQDARFFVLDTGQSRTVVAPMPDGPPVAPSLLGSRATETDSGRTGTLRSAAIGGSQATETDTGRTGVLGTLVTAERWMKGTWATIQMGTVAGLLAQETILDEMLTQPGIVGMSLRVPWQDVDNNNQAYPLFTSLLTEAQRIVDDHGKKLTIRPMAGRFTPDRILNLGTVATYFLANSPTEKAPSPFFHNPSDTQATPYAANQVFIDEWETFSQVAVDWSRTNGARVFHASWFGGMWAELNCGEDDVRLLPGFTYNKWLTGHKALMDVAVDWAQSDMGIEWPTTGAGTGNITDEFSVVHSIFNDITAYMMTKVDTATGQKWGVGQNNFVNNDGNVVGPNNGNALTTTQRAKLMKQLQMYGADHDYDGFWNRIFFDPLGVQAIQATYLEVYYTSAVADLYTAANTFLAGMSGSRATETDTGRAGVIVATAMSGTQGTETDTGQAGVIVVTAMSGARATETDTGAAGALTSASSANAYQLETTTDRYLLEDGSGVYLMEA